MALVSDYFKKIKRAGVQEEDMLKVFRSSVRPILKYALQVWQDIPDYLSDRIESVQTSAFKIIYPNSSYSQALSLANETTLSNRRASCVINLWLRWQTPVTTHYPAWCPLLYKELILITLDLVLLDHSTSSWELRDQRTFLLLKIRLLSIGHDYLFKYFFLSSIIVHFRVRYYRWIKEVKTHFLQP